jgi:DNA-binding transcriptional MerR regulator/effector-binding domain-containing protein
MFSIGEFSQITGLSIKTLRFYHEQGLLTPAWVDEQTGYRYYDSGRVAKARIITQLRALEFPLNQIREILAEADDDADILTILEGQRALLDQKAQQYRNIVRCLQTVIHHEKEARNSMMNSAFAVQEKVLEPMLMAGVRMKGKYSDSGQGFRQIGKNLGRYISGKCFLLHYDTECREDDADFEACMPLRKGKAVAGISIRELPGGRCISLLHRGPYEELGRSYEKILAFIKEKGYEIIVPTREVYLKGPGMIFRGNPKNYLTEIQMLVRELRKA